MDDRSHRIDVALQDPKAAFESPAAVERDPDLTRAEKVAILTAWENDAREMAVAEEENMGGGEPSLVEEVVAARTRVAGGSPAETETASHKQGGAAPDPEVLRVRHFMRYPGTEVHPDHDLDEAWARMSSQESRILPVSDGDQIVGVVARGDLELGRQQEPGARRRPSTRDVMSTRIAYVFPDDELATARAMMDRHGCDHLLVIDADRRLIGLLCREDLPIPLGPSAPDDDVAAGREGASGGISSTVQPGGLDVYAETPKVKASGKP